MSTAENILTLVERDGFVTLDTLKNCLSVKEGTIIRALHHLQSNCSLLREERGGRFIYTVKSVGGSYGTEH
jgi:DeoR/GlpR family transcriptional regulator of sugar metabolism